MKKIYNIYRVVAILEAILLLIISFSYGSKIDKQKEIINNQNQIIEKCKEENIKLRLIEEDYNTSKEYIYECYKQIEQRAERSGK